MSEAQTLQEVMKDMELAGAMARQASELFYKASKKLAGVSTPSSKKKQSVLSDEAVVKLLGKRMRRACNKTKAQ